MTFGNDLDDAYCWSADYETAEAVDDFYGPGPSYDDFRSTEDILMHKMELIFNYGEYPVPDALGRVLTTALKLRRSAYTKSLKMHMQNVCDGKCDRHRSLLPQVWTDNHHFNVVKWLLQVSNDEEQNSQYMKIQRELSDEEAIANGDISEADIALATMIESELCCMTVSLIH